MAVQIAPTKCPICLSADRNKSDASGWDGRLLHYALNHREELCDVHTRMLQAHTNFFRRMITKHLHKD